MDSLKYSAVGFLFALYLVPSLLWASSAVPAEYQAAAEKIVDGFNARDPEPFSQAVDADRLLDAALSGLFVDTKPKREFAEGFKRGMKARSPATQLIQRMPEGGYAKLLRIKMDGDIGQALMRVDFGEYGTGYFDLYLSPGGNGEIKVADWFSYASGQFYSETIRQIAASVLPTPTVLGKVYDAASDRKEGAGILMEFAAMSKRGEYAQAVRKFLALDEDLRKSRLLNIVAFKLANLSDDMELYGKVLENIDRHFGTDERMSFILIDYYYLEGDYDKAIETTDRMQASFGVEDPGVIVLKANALLEKGEVEEALAQAKHAIELEPEYEYAYLVLLGAQIRQKQFAQAVSTADVLEKRFFYDLGSPSLSEDEYFRDFAESAEYREWRSGR